MPTTLEALIILALFSIPAYLAVAVYRTRNPVSYYQEKQSPIEQAALYIFLGTLVNILAAQFMCLLWLLAAVLRNLIPTKLIHTVGATGGSTGGQAFAAFLFTVAYLGISAIFSFLVGNILGRLVPIEEPLWFTELNKLKVMQIRTDTAHGTKWVLIQLKNGDRLLGLLSEFRWIGDKDNTMELIIEKTYYQLAHSASKHPAGRVVLRSIDILWLGAYSNQVTD